MTATLPGMPVDLSPDAIERELSAMWDTHADDAETNEHDSDEGGITRIAVGNLVWFSSSRHIERARGVFRHLVKYYPCRLFLLEFMPERTSPEIEAFVTAQCVLSPEARKEVCCEEIFLRFGPAGAPHLEGALRPLLLADVPTTLVYRSAEPERYQELLGDLVRLSEQVLTDVGRQDDPVGGLRRMAEGARGMSLDWYRDAPVREQVAAIFDDPRVAGLLAEIDEVTLEIAPREEERSEAASSAALLVGWLASRLKWKPTNGDAWPVVFRGPKGEVRVSIERTQRANPANHRFVRIAMHCRTGDAMTLTAVDVDGVMERCLSGPTVGDCLRPLMVHAPTLEVAPAVGQALTMRARMRYFREAAAVAWPVLAATLRREKETSR